MKILVVESSALSREVLCAELEELRFPKELRSASSLGAAEQTLNSFVPDVMLVDLQLPEHGAFRLVDRPWENGVPLIVCTTVFDHGLLEILSRHHVDYLVRPFSPGDLHYAITQNRRPEYVGTAFSLRNLLDAAASIGYPVRHGMPSWLGGKLLATSIASVVAIRYDGTQYYLWTESGIQLATGIGPQVNQAMRSGLFAKYHENAMISTRPHLFGSSYRRAVLWLQWNWLKDRARRLLPRRSHLKPHGNGRSAPHPEPEIPNNGNAAIH